MKLTPHQQEAFRALKQFILDEQQRIFVLKGYAGTGKTTLLGRLCAWCDTQDLAPMLLATTGRAAKVLTNKTGRQAATIHSAIYLFEKINDGRKESDSEKDWDPETHQLALDFGLRSNKMLPKNLVFIVDEASMISHMAMHHEQHTAKFGSGSLLDDFIKYAEGRKIVFVGDPCQLPPVAEDPFSAALDDAFLRQRYRVPVAAFELREIIRQQAGNEILHLAGWFRERSIRKAYEKWPQIRLPQGRNAHLYPNDEAFLTKYAQTLQKGAPEDAILIGQANKQVHNLNTLIRQKLGRGQALRPGEMLMVVQNSYACGLTNGDQVLVEEVREHPHRLQSLSFLEVKLRALHDNQAYETLLIKELLYREEPGLSAGDAQRLLIDFDIRSRGMGFSRKSETYKMHMMTDPYYNALRAKFGYAITAHKSQGGEWAHVFLHIVKSLYGLPRPELYRWYYTALTRAQQHLHLNDGFWVEGFKQNIARRI